MSLVKKRKKASESTVDAPKRFAREQMEPDASKALPTGEMPPETAPEAPQGIPEPLGGHGSEGNREARAAFLRDEGGDMPLQDGKPSEDGEEATQSIPSMSIEQIAALATVAIDMGGTYVGNKVLKRPDAEWPLEPQEKQNVEQALVPVLSEALKDTKVTPMHALVGILLTCYVPRVMMMAATKNPNAAPETPAPQVTAPPAPETVVPPPVEQQTVQHEKAKATNHGWQ